MPEGANGRQGRPGEAREGICRPEETREAIFLTPPGFLCRPLASSSFSPLIPLGLALIHLASLGLLRFPRAPLAARRWSPVAFHCFFFPGLLGLLPTAGLQLPSLVSPGFPWLRIASLGIPWLPGRGCPLTTLVACRWSPIAFPCCLWPPPGFLWPPADVPLLLSACLTLLEAAWSGIIWPPEIHPLAAKSVHVQAACKIDE